MGRGWFSFEVAVWKYWPSYALPVIEEGVLASSAFEAVELVMRAYGMRWVGHAAALAADGSIQYRAYGVLLAGVREREEKCASEIRQVDLWASAGDSDGQTEPLTLNALLFGWGQAHGFPELLWPLPESPELEGIIPAGERWWVECCKKGLPQYVRAAYWAAMRKVRV